LVAYLQVLGTMAELKDYRPDVEQAVETSEKAQK
jgi:hypothetical protein